MIVSKDMIVLEKEVSIPRRQLTIIVPGDSGTLRNIWNMKFESEIACIHQSGEPHKVHPHCHPAPPTPGFLRRSLGSGIMCRPLEGSPGKRGHAVE